MARLPARNDIPQRVDPLREKRRKLMVVAIIALVAAALLVLLLPLRLPLPLRVAVAGTDLLAAIVIGVYVRQVRAK